MKICMISALYEKDIMGGAEIYLEKIVNHLSENNDVIIITSDRYLGLNSLKPSKEISSKETKGRMTIYRFYPANIYGMYNTYRKPIWMRAFYSAKNYDIVAHINGLLDIYKNCLDLYEKTKN